MSNIKSLREKVQLAYDATIQAAAKDNTELFDQKHQEFTDLQTRLAKVEAMEKGKPVVDAGGNTSSGDPVADKNFAGFSFVKAIRETLNGRVTGLEAEALEQGRIESETLGARGNISLPQSVLFSRPDTSKMALRPGRGGYVNTMGVTTGTPAGSEGGDTVETTLSRSFIDLLLESTVLSQAGASFFTNLQGDLEFPKFTRSTVRPAVKAETADANKLSPGTDSVKLVPERLPAFIPLTWQLLNQSNLDIEAWIRNYLAREIAISWETLALDKIFASNAVGKVELGDDGGNLTFADVVKFETEVDDNNALMNRLHYITNSRVRGILKSTETFPGSNGRPIWDTGNVVNGYQSLVTNVIPKNFEKGNSGETLSGMIFGNWSDLYLGQWGGFQFITDNVTEAKKGIINLHMFTFVDQEIARDESFAVSKDIATIPVVPAE